MGTKAGSEVIHGSSFLVEDHPLEKIFIPEEFNEEEKMLGALVWDFVEGSVVPQLEALESLSPGAMPAVLKEAGKLDLLAVDVPPAYGGFGQSKAVSMLVTEKLAKSGSFQAAFGGHTGIGTLPIVYFGTKEQKEKYLPRLATGEILGCYALTEADSGSDAMNARSTAVMSQDGKHYVLNGEKLFVTNAGFADLYIVFSKVDGEKFTAFILEKGMEGLSLGPEEKKMGIKGSSTRSLIMQDVKVPVENVLGRIGRGAQIAFNILNVGRFKLGAGAVGVAILSIVDSVKYGNQRHQFGRPITSFGMIKEKIAEMACRSFAAQSMVYRTAGYIDQYVATLDKNDEDYDAKVAGVGIREYMTECSMLKVFCTEVLDYCVDEAVQIFGGYGYTQEYPAERYYRDSRINRIFEGTNEINRMIISSEVLKKAAKNQVPIFAQAKVLLDELKDPQASKEKGDESFLAEERKFVAQAKKATLLSLGLVGQQLGEKLKEPMEHEEVLGLLSDTIMDVYGMESSLLRSLKLMDRGETEKAILAGKMTRGFCNDALHRIEIRARDIAAAVCQGDMLASAMVGIHHTVRHTPVGTVALRREIADAIIACEEWPI